MNFISKEHTRFIKSLIDHKVRFIIVGGYAAIYYGVLRSTGDLDILISNEADNGQRLLKAMSKLKLRVPEISDEEFEKELVLSFGFEPDAIDIINTAPGIVFDDAFRRARTVVISRMKVKMIDIDDLIKNKESLRRKGERALLDEFDVKSLKKIKRRNRSD